MLLGESARMIAIGLVIGASGAFWFGRVLGAMHERVKGPDPAMLASVAAALFAVALAATLLPALRSARVDPMSVLRHE